MSFLKVIPILLVSLLLSAVSVHASPDVTVIEETLAANPILISGIVHSQNELTIGASVSGQLTKIAEVGDKVSRNELVAKLKGDEFELQKIEQQAFLYRAQIEGQRLTAKLNRQHQLIATNSISQEVVETTESSLALSDNDIEIARIRIQQLEEKILRTSFRAPFAGVVVETYHNVGEQVEQGEKLLYVADLTQLQVRASVPLQHVSKLAVGDSVTVVGPDSTRVATVQSITPFRSAQNRFYEARLRMVEDGAIAWPIGHLVQVVIPANDVDRRFVLPRSAVIRRLDSAFVLRSATGSDVEKVYVTVMECKDGLLIVSGELHDNDNVITQAERYYDTASN